MSPAAPRRGQSWLVALPLLLAAFLALISPAAATPEPPALEPAIAAPTATAADAALDVEILDLQPVVLTDGSDLVLRLRVANTTTDVIDTASVTVLAQEWTPTTRTSLARWLDLGRYRATLPLSTTDLEPLAAGESREFEVSVPSASFHFTTWGPRGLEVAADGTAAGIPFDADRERTWVLWWDEPTVSPTAVGVLAPVTPTVDELSGQPGALDRVLALLEQATIPGVTPVIDPVVLTLADGDPVLDGRVTAAVAALADRSLALPWANADAAALLDANQADLYRTLLDRGSAALATAGVAPAGSVDWPLDPDLATLAGTGGDVVVLPGAAFPERSASNSTPDALATVAGRTAVVLDTELGEALRGTARVDGEDVTLTPLQQRQYIAGTLAVVTRERPGQSRLVVTALPFDDDAASAALVEVVAGLPWVTPADLPAALTGEGPATEPPAVLDAGTLPAEAILPDTALTGDKLGAIESTAATLRLAGELVVDPATVVDPLSARLSLQPSATWRQAPLARDLQFAEVAEQAATLTGGITVRASSTINMLSGSANFPVTVTSTLPVDAVVQVNLEPSDRLLREVEPRVVTVPAGGEASAQVPVVAAGWADFTVDVVLTTVAGTPVGEVVAIPVRVRADWENLGMTALVAGAGLAFVVGVVRTVRRNRATGRAAEIDAAAEELDDLARANEGEGDEP